MSVSPITEGCVDAELMANEVDSDADDVPIPNELSAGFCERVVLEKEDSVVRYKVQ